MRFRSSTSEEVKKPALQGLTGRVTRRFLAVPPTLLRFVTRTLPSASPAKRVSRSVARPEVRMPCAAQERPKALCRFDPEGLPGGGDAPKGSGGYP